MVYTMRVKLELYLKKSEHCSQVTVYDLFNSSGNWDVAVHKVKLLTMLYRTAQGFCSLVSF